MGLGVGKEYKKEIYNNPKKKCIHCKESYNLEFFYKNSASKLDGHRNTCKFCCSERDKRNKALHKEKNKQLAKEYSERNKDKIKKYKQKWYERKKEEFA